MPFTDEQIDRILAECHLDTSFAGKFFLPELFYRPFDPIHKQIFDVIDGIKWPYKYIVAPRGIGKTSISNILLPLKKALLHEARYIVPVSATSDLAMQQSENLKYFSTSNEIVREFFGDLTFSEEGDRRTFSKKQWVINVGGREVCVMPRGAGQQVRGQLWRGIRPDLIIVDDLENSEEARNEEQRKHLKEWFKSDLLGSVDRGRKDWQIIVVGTILHQDSLLMNLVEDKRWKGVVLEICDDDFKSNAPNVMTDQECRELYEFYAGEDGDGVDIFFREYRSKPVAGGADGIFQKRFFNYYNEADLQLDKNADVEQFLVIDVAKTANQKSAESAILHIAVNIRTNAIYVRDIIRGRFHPDQFLDEVVKMASKPKIMALGVEVTGLNEFVTYPIKNELIRNKLHHVEVIELHARGGKNEKGKIERVRSMVPFYRKGLVYHNRAVCAPLEQQLLSFPAAKRWDIMDALGYVPEMMDIGMRFMLPVEDEETKDTKESIEREFAVLEEDYWEPLSGYRRI